MIDRYTKRAKMALNMANQAAVEMMQSSIGTEHLLIGLVREGSGVASIVLSQHEVTEEAIQKLLENMAPHMAVTYAIKADTYSPKAREVISLAEKEADRQGSVLVGTEHLLIGLLNCEECLGRMLLKDLNVNLSEIYEDIYEMIGKPMPTPVDPTGNPFEPQESKALDTFCRDLTRMAEEGKLDPVIGRGKEINRLIQILSRRTKNNPCLIGEPGVGKSAVVEGLATKIVEGEVPETMIGKRVMTLDLSGMVAGTKYRGEFEERIKNLLNDLIRDGNVLLFIDEIHTIIGAGGAEGALDAANILKPSLARGEIQIIGATTIQEYRRHIEKDGALERRFQPVMVEEPTIEESIDILSGLKSTYEKHHGVTIEPEAIVSAVKLSARYINDRNLPDKAIDVMDEAASRARLSAFTMPKGLKGLKEELRGLEGEKEKAIIQENYTGAAQIRTRQAELKKKIEKLEASFERQKKKKQITVTAEDMAVVVSDMTRIPVQSLAQSETERLIKLESILHERVVGQEEAVSAVARAIRRGRVGLKDPKRPIGSFLFLGPTGVGKTELCKALAWALFGKESAMIRVDMSEYMEKHSVSKLIGSPPGYVGFEEGGQLSEKVRKNPYSVLLFDEIEKAHEDVFNILLQVLDDGIITDSQGRKVDFKNTVIIMTSNCGAKSIQNPKTLGFGRENNEQVNHAVMKERVMEEVKRTFKPEFLNRIDEIIVFHSLLKEQMKEILMIMIGDITKRLKEQMSLSLELTDAAMELLIEKGYDRQYGARPLKRAIQTLIEDKLAEEILSGKISGGRVLVDAADKELTFDEQGQKA